MRIRNITIERWRNFDGIALNLDEEAGLVCVIGANGTGKSHLLELIAACAHQLGLAQGIEIPRGDPFKDDHEFSLVFYLAEGFNQFVEQQIASIDQFDQWDRTLIVSSIRSRRTNKRQIAAGGFDNSDYGHQFAAQVVDKVRASKDVFFLSLDADRAYPKKRIHHNEMAQAYETDWENTEFTRGRSFRPTTTLYDEWIKYLLAKENQTGERLMQGMRKARKEGTQTPDFIDPFEDYTDSLQDILPHVRFSGVDSKKRTLLFDTAGMELTFDQLSGGEREIAFLLGQIHRFGLRQGLFLLDEPELHLNSALIRTWVEYLTSTVHTGQIWLATHSMEAIEATGQQSTFTLEREIHSRKVKSVARLDTQPVLSALARTVGTPAFSISNAVFVFVEGDDRLGDRERYRELADTSADVRFLGSGSCQEVLRRVATIRELSNESATPIRVGGIVDRDFRTQSEVKELKEHKNVHPLAVHEIENFFLHCPTLDYLLIQNGNDQLSAKELVMQASDARAGSWVFQNAMSRRIARALPRVPPAAKSLAKALTWEDFSQDRPSAIDSILTCTGFENEHRRKLKQLLGISATSYGRKREQANLWKICEGKQILKDVAIRVGFAGPPHLERAMLAAWTRNDVPLPTEVAQVRKYVTAI